MDGSPTRLYPDQPVLPLDGQRPHLRIHAINIFVRDQDQSLRFYVDQLGFSLVGDVCFGSGERWVAVAPPDGSAVLSLVAPKTDSKQYGLIGRSTQVVFITDDVVAKFREWRKRGVQFLYTPRLKQITYERKTQTPGLTDRSLLPGEEPPIWGGVFTHFKDLDGNSFALVSFDEESRAVEAQRQAGAGTALSPNASVHHDARLFRDLHPSSGGRRRLLRFPRSWPGSAWTGGRRYCGERDRGCSLNGQSASEPAQPVRHRVGPTAALPAIGQSPV